MRKFLEITVFLCITKGLKKTHHHLGFFHLDSTPLLKKEEKNRMNKKTSVITKLKRAKKINEIKNSSVVLGEITHKGLVTGIESIENPKKKIISNHRPLKFPETQIKSAQRFFGEFVRVELSAAQFQKNIPSDLPREKRKIHTQKKPSFPHRISYIYLYLFTSSCRGNGSGLFSGPRKKVEAHLGLAEPYPDQSLTALAYIIILLLFEGRKDETRY